MKKPFPTAKPFAYLALSLAALGLASCTGSVEAPNPILLVTGFSNSPTDSGVVLVRDDLTASDERFTYLPESVRPLPAPPVSYDLTNREQARSRLVVLSRAPAANGQATGTLSFFNLSRLDADNPTTFDQNGEITLDNTLPAVPETFPANRQFCPFEVQVTQSGRYAAVLNVPSLCGTNQRPFIDLLDLQGGGRILQRINLQIARSRETGGIYLSQSSAEDILYYAVRSPSSLTLQAFTMPRPSDTFDPNDPLEIAPRTVTTVTAAAGQGNFVDLTLAGDSGSERLAVLFEDSLAYVTGYTGTGTVSGPVETEPDNLRVLRDDTRQTEATLVLAAPQADRFSYFLSDFDTDTGSGGELISGEESEDLQANDGVIEPNNGFVYFVRAGFISLFDLRSYDEGQTLETTLFPIAGLPTPVFVTWAQALPPTTSPTSR